MRAMLPTLWSELGGDPFRHLRNEIDRVFADFGAATPAAEAGLLPLRWDVNECDAAIEIAADLPGVNDKDIEISVAGGVLTIRAERKAETERKNGGYRMVERGFGRFERSLALPYAVDGAKIAATFDKGVLRVMVPKPPEAQTATRRIPVQAAA